ncbi:MAG: hypothetical protein H7Z72_14495 [Bacteroidetes bacterium]|nr:hypothetical protein [Fibrella sp.]
MTEPVTPAPTRSTEEDQPATATGLNPDPDYQKLAGIVEFTAADDELERDDDALSSDDTDDDRE